MSTLKELYSQCDCEICRVVATLDEEVIELFEAKVIADETMRPTFGDQTAADRQILVNMGVWPSAKAEEEHELPMGGLG